MPARSVTATTALPDCAGLATLVATTVCVPTAVPAVYRPPEVTTPTAALPPAMPSTAHVAAPPPGTVAVNCWVCDTVSVAIVGTTVTAPLEIVTVAVTRLLAPPAPLQLKEYDVVAVRAPVLCVPLVALAPLQPPEAVQDVALVELHVSVEVPPLAMTEGFATKVAVGTILTRTVDTPLVPPVPVQVKEYELGIVIAPVLCVPLVALLPVQPPEAVQEVAFVELHVSVEVPPLAIKVGFAVNVTVGAGTTMTVAVATLLVPPTPLQLKE
jgi:hypothetical protein